MFLNDILCTYIKLCLCEEEKTISLQKKIESGVRKVALGSDDHPVFETSLSASNDRELTRLVHNITCEVKIINTVHHYLTINTILIIFRERSILNHCSLR